MFNFFKTKETATEVVSKYPKEVLEIHHEFETAADKLLDEANIIIKEAASKDVVKISRLESLGFKQAAQVVEIKPLLEKAALSKEQVELINYYKHNYPFNKFITEDQVQTICHKYNLVCGPVNRFKGFVPEKNLREIEKFQLKENDKYSLICSNGMVLKNAEIRQTSNGYYHIYKIEEKDMYKYAFQSNNGVDFYGNDSKNIFEYIPGMRTVESTRFSIVNKTLQICAPVKDMDISGLELVEGYKLTKVHIPDPVVLQPVNGGYLILTAWGDEASDPLVINEINN